MAGEIKTFKRMRMGTFIVEAESRVLCNDITQYNTCAYIQRDVLLLSIVTRGADY